MTLQEFKFLIFIGSLIALFITYLCGRQYNKTLERISGPRQLNRAEPHEDLNLVFCILIFGATGLVGIVFSILIYLNVLTLHHS